MRFYYRIYQKTKVLTRKRKKKSTKTNNKNHPAKKRKADTAPVDPAPQNGMEVDEVESKPNKISSKLNGEAREGAKDKVNSVKEKEVKKVTPVIKNSSPKVSFGGVETKPLKSVTINQNISYSSEKPDKVPSKAKPLSPILKNGSSEKNKLHANSTRKSPVIESKPKSNLVSQNSLKSNPQPSKKMSTPPVSSSKVSGVTQSKPVKSAAGDKKTSPESSKPTGGKEKVTQLPSVTPTTKTGPQTQDKPLTNGVKSAEPAAKQKTVSDKPVKKIIPDTKKQSVENQVVEISVEVSASDIKKVLEKKKAEKDAKLISNGEERLFSNYSIVDQLKKSTAAANLANQKKQQAQASMMDFTRSSEAFSGPKVPPTIQGLQPKASGGTEKNVLSAIVHSLAQKQQSLNQKIQAATSNNDNKSGDQGKETPAPVSEKSGKGETDKTKSSDAAAKTLGTMAGLLPPSLSTKTGSDKTVTAVTTAKLPISTSIKPITTSSSSSQVNSGQTNSSADSSGKGAGLGNLFKNGSSTGKTNTNNTQEATKNAESLTKNIPAGTTVTVKTVETKQAKVPSPSSTPTSKNSPGFRMNLSNSTFSLGKGANNPYSSANVDVMSQTLMNQQLSLLAAQHATAYNSMLNLNAINQLEAAAYLKNTAASILRASAKSPMTTLAFTKPNGSDDGRMGLKIPQPSVSRQSSPTISSFGTSRLQVKVNSDSEKTEKGSTGSSKAQLTGGSHSLPAQLPFHDMKKVHAIPKSFNSSGRSPISSLLKTQNTSTKSPPLASSPPKSPVVGPKPIISSNPGSTDKTGQSPVKQSSGGKLTVANKPVNQVNSLKKLVADLNSAQKKKAENLLNTLQKSQENKLLSEKKSFLGLDQNINEKHKEVTSS